MTIDGDWDEDTEDERQERRRNDERRAEAADDLRAEDLWDRETRKAGG